MNDQNVIICRCEDITLAEIKTWMEKGFVTFEDLKRQLRVGMGPCQGQTCGELIQRELAKFLNKRPEEIPMQKTRPLTMGVQLKAIAKGDKQ